MKQFVTMISILFLGCTTSNSKSKKDWSSGAEAQSSYDQQRMEETTDQVRKQLPSSLPGTESH